jgi:sortase A
MTAPGHRPEFARLLRILEMVFLIAAMMALGWAAGGYVRAARDQANWASELERLTSGPVPRGAPAGFEPALRPATGALIGRLEVPRLGVSVITREGVDARTLRSAVGHVPTTALPGQTGNAAFAGHRDTFFRRLEDIREGDRVVVTTPRARHEYVVRGTRIVTPSDVSVLDPTGEPVLTLVTCYPFTYIGSAPQRFIVRATLAKNTTATSAVGAAAIH